MILYSGRNYRKERGLARHVYKNLRDFIAENFSISDYIVLGSFYRHLLTLLLATGLQPFLFSTRFSK